MLLNNSIFNLLLFLFAANLAHAGNIFEDARQSIQLDDAAGVMEDLQRGLDVNFVDEDGHSLLMLAAKEGSTKTTAVLLNAGAKTYLSNAYGDNALLLATFGGHEAIVDMLLAKQASLGANPRGWTPLHYAAYAGHTRLVSKFLARGAQINNITDNGLTPLMLASMNGHIEAVRVMLKHHADVEMRDENKLNAADHAMAKGNTFIVALLRAATLRK